MKFDVAIIGGGPAGLSAGIFTTRAGLSTICFEKLAIGGQASLSYDIANYPGFETISGFELTNKMFEHAKKSGVEFEYANVLSLTKKKTDFNIQTKTKTYTAKKVILACGAKARKLNLANEQKFTGRGISYCASCDGNFFKNKVVAVVGGGNTAVEDVEYLSKIAKQIYLINRSESFKAGEHNIAKIKKFKNLKILTSSEVAEIKGDKTLEEIVINSNNNLQTLKVDGLFIAIGYEPDLSFVNIDVEKDKYGYLVVEENQQTSIKNLYACGDIVSKKFKQVISACADGARAGNSCIGG